MKASLEKVVSVLELSRTELCKTNGLEISQLQTIWTEKQENTLKSSLCPNLEEHEFVVDHILKRDNKDLKGKCEKFLTQIRIKDTQINELLASIHKLKQQQYTPTNVLDEKYNKFCTEYETCIVTSDKLEKQGKSKSHELNELVTSLRRSNDRIKVLSEENCRVNKELEAHDCTEQQLMHQMTQYKTTAIDLVGTVRSVLKEKDARSQAERDALAGKDALLIALEHERALNHQLSAALTVAERENTTALSTLADASANYSRTLQQQEATIEALRASIQDMQQQVEKLEDKRADGSAQRQLLHPPEETSSPLPKRARSEVHQPIVPLPARELSAPPLQRGPPGLCPICAENPSGLMVRCSVCSESFHSSCARRSGGSRSSAGVFTCDNCSV